MLHTGSSLLNALVQTLCQIVQRRQIGHLDILFLGDLDGVADDGLDLERAAGHGVGQHARLDAGRVDAGLGAAELVLGLVLCDFGVAAGLGDLDDLEHDLPHEAGAVGFGGWRKGLLQAGEVVGGVPGGVDEQLGPAAGLDVVVDEDGGAAALDQLHELAQLRGLGDGGGGEGADLEALEVAHFDAARARLRGGQVDDAREDGVAGKGAVPLVLDADAILDEHDGGARRSDGGGDEGWGAGGGAREGLGADEDEVPGRVDGGRGDLVDDGGLDAQVLAEDAAVDGEAVLPDVVEVAAAHAGDLGAGARQDPGVDAADAAGAED